jgi:hypothetical protein
VAPPFAAGNRICAGVVHIALHWVRHALALAAAASPARRRPASRREEGLWQGALRAAEGRLPVR